MTDRDPAVVDLTSKPDLLVIGGAPRSGKTLLARKFWLDNDIPSFTMDAAIASFVEMAPDAGIGWQESPDRPPKIATAASFIAQTALVVHGRYLIEGESMTPAVSHILGGAFTIHSCYLVLLKPRLDDIVQYEEQDGWVQQLSAADQQVTLENIAARSAWLVRECERWNTPYVDLSTGSFELQMQRAQSILLTSVAARAISQA